jgi:hypothetical protein
MNFATWQNFPPNWYAFFPVLKKKKQWKFTDNLMCFRFWKEILWFRKKWEKITFVNNLWMNETNWKIVINFYSKSLEDECLDCENLQMRSERMILRCSIYEIWEIEKNSCHKKIGSRKRICERSDRLRKEKRNSVIQSRFLKKCEEFWNFYDKINYYDLFSKYR